ncbi:MAG: isocitrate lyase/PEP mutase family protein [Gammaproteobacteria bacterium]|nr:MAG: isocitrate lyase/PEP mutase family protein [Gammaproteobacteria bacterium]
MTLRERLQEGGALLAPGAYDALSALLIERAGFEAAYVSGASIAYTQLARPDIGLVSFDHLADVVARIAERVSLPLIVDADTGFGNVLNVRRTVTVLERLGASAVQLEDQTSPKRCGHLTGKNLIPSAQMLGKIRAACDARTRSGTLIIARTDAIAVEGLSAALERAGAYAAAGADVLFVEAPRSLEEMQQVANTLAHRAPLVANMVEGGRTPLQTLAQLSGLGFRLIIFPGALVRATVPHMEAFLASLKRDGTSQAFAPLMTDIGALNERVGLPELSELGRVYEEGDAGGSE